MENAQQAGGGQRGGFDAGQLKLLAIFGMTLDHIGIVFGPYLSLGWTVALYALGGLTFPIMAFLMVEGYRYTTNLRRYILRMLLFGAAALLPFMWAFRTTTLNVMFTLALGCMGLYLYDHLKNRLLFALAFLGLILLSSFMDWPLMGVPMVLLYRVLKGKWKRLILPVLLPMGMMVTPAVTVLIHQPARLPGVLPSLAYALIGCSLTIPLLARYNGGRGRPMKYFFYAYYPLHLVVLVVIRGLLFQDWGGFLPF